MKRTILIAALCAFAASALAAQQPEHQQPEPQPQQQQDAGPCVHGNTRAIISGVDVNETRCQLEMVARRLGLLEFQLTQLQAKNALLQSDLDAAEKAKSAAKPDEGNAPAAAPKPLGGGH